MRAFEVLHDLVCGLLPDAAIDAVVRLHELLGLL